MACVQVATFYNSNFPTDKKTYLIRVPVIGLVLSIVSWQIFSLMIWQLVDALYLLHLAYILSAAAVSVELYWGLSIGDRKQFAPWVILKFFEISLTLASLLYIIITDVEPPFEGFKAGTYLFGFITLLSNILLYGVVVKKYLNINMRTRNEKANNTVIEEEIYADCGNP